MPHRIPLLFFAPFIAIYININLLQAQTQADSVLNLTKDLNGEPKIAALMDIIHEMADEYQIVDYHLYKAIASEINKIPSTTAYFRLNYIKGISHKKLSEYDSAMHYLELARVLGNKVNDADLVVKSNMTLADTYLRLGRADEAEQLLNEQMKIATRAGMEFNVAAIHNNLASVFQRKGLNTKAMEHFLKAIAYFEKVNDYRQLGVLYANIGNLNLDVPNYHQARDLYFKALQNARKAGDRRQEAAVLTNLGVVYSRMDSINAAMQYFNQSIAVIQQLGDKEELARAYHNIAKIQVDNNNLKEGLANYRRSLGLSKEIRTFQGELFNHYSVGRTFQILGRFDQALRHYDTVRQMLDKVPNPEFQLYVLYAIQSVHASMGNKAKAYPYLLQAYNTNDSLLRSGNQERIAALQAQYDQAKEESRALKLEQEILEHKGVMRLWIIFGLSGLIALLAIAIWMTIGRRRSVLKALYAEAELERTRMELDFRRRELVSSAILLAETQEKVEKIEESLNEVKTKAKGLDAELFNGLTRQLKSISPQRKFSEFEKRFDAVNEQFNTLLVARHPELSPAELRICSLLRLGLSSKEIAGITNRTVRTIENSRSIIRRKLSLGNDENLVTYLAGIQEDRSLGA